MVSIGLVIVNGEYYTVKRGRAVPLEEYGHNQICLCFLLSCTERHVPNSLVLEIVLGIALIRSWVWDDIGDNDGDIVGIDGIGVDVAPGTQCDTILVRTKRWRSM